MQHQYWVTKKSVLRKLGGKEDECVVASDAELDAKLELFRSISDSCIQLQKVIDLYQERLCYLAQEENALGILHISLSFLPLKCHKIFVKTYLPRELNNKIIKPFEN